MAEQKKQPTPAQVRDSVVKKQDQVRIVEYAEDRSRSGTVTVTNSKPAPPNPHGDGGNKKG